ncbi:helix-turn-helix domain-containing protein [Bradyrhizobium sp. USDA 10063]
MSISRNSPKESTPLSPPMRQRLTAENHVHLNQHGVRTMMHPARYAGPVLGKSSLLAYLVDEMADWDIPCPDQARALSLKIIPGTSPVLVINYRKPPVLTRRFGPQAFRQPDRRNCATKLHSGLVIVQPGGALGVIVIRLKAEAAANLLGERMLDFLDAQIGLDELFPASRMSRLEEILAYARTSAERFACVEKFLHANQRTRRTEPVTSRAAALLRRNPQLRVGQLAARIDVSERQLLRNFYTMFGMGTKQFARIARIERVMAARARGATWRDVAYKLGFSDQAHMINEFTEIVGVSPAELVRPGTGCGKDSGTPQSSAKSR